MIILSLFSVGTIALLSYIQRGNRYMAKIAIGLSITVVACGELSLYGNVYERMGDSAFLSVLHGGALASVSWLIAFLLAFPTTGVVAMIVALVRRFKDSSKERETLDKGQGGDRGLSRRKFLTYASTAIPVAALSTSIVGNVVGESYLDVTHHELYYPDLPDYLDSYCIGQISDTHIGLFFSPEDVEDAMRRLVEEKVQRLEITGDLIDELSRLPECEAVLRKMAPLFPDGIDFCYGNHEYYRGIEAITDMLERTPVRILRNESFCVSPGRGEHMANQSGQSERPFYIAGVDFSFAPKGPEDDARRKAYTAQALSRVPDDAFIVMLAHNSSFIDEAFAHDIPLLMSGHTHGAQFAPIGPIVEAVGFKYLRGMYRKNGSYGYVNRGTGHWLPFRVLCSREATVYTLRKGRA